MRQELKLGDNIMIQYGTWLKRLMQFDLGRYIYTKRPVSQELGERLPALTI